MKEKKKRRWLRKPRIPKINEDTMTSIVIYSLVFCVIVTIAGMVLACYGIDVSAIVSSTHTIFGAELGICGLIKVFDRRMEKEDKEEEKNCESEKNVVL